jgi:hypothetical protein
MPNETHTVVSRSVEEEKGIRGVVQDVFETCPAQCPTCQQSCAYTAGHGGFTIVRMGMSGFHPHHSDE